MCVPTNYLSIKLLKHYKDFGIIQCCSFLLLLWINMHFMITWDKKTCLKYVSQQVEGFYYLNNDFHFCSVINSKPISHHRPTQSFIILPQEISVCSKKNWHPMFGLWMDLKHLPIDSCSPHRPNKSFAFY